jgi:hypothetical protein
MIHSCKPEALSEISEITLGQSANSTWLRFILAKIAGELYEEFLAGKMKTLFKSNALFFSFTSCVNCDFL